MTVHQAPDAVGDQRVSLDGLDVPGMTLSLVDDRADHRVEVWMRTALAVKPTAA